MKVNPRELADLEALESEDNPEQVVGHKLPETITESFKKIRLDSEKLADKRTYGQKKFK